MNKYLTFIFSSLILIFNGYLHLCAQVSNVPFNHLNKPISQNTGTCIIEDHKGFLWIGTTNGLNKYDGQEVITYEFDSNDTTSISNNHIRKIVEDGNGDLWIATENGLNRFIRELNRFERYFLSSNNNSLASNNISDLVIDSKGGLWISAGDLCLYRANSNDFLRIQRNANQVSRDPYNNFIYEDKSGDIWYGNWKQLFKLNSKNKTLDLFFDGEKHQIGPSEWHFRQLLQDSKGDFWLSTYKAGLYKFRTDSPKLNLQRFHDSIGDELLSDSRILTMFIDHNGLLWVSCENAGLVVFDSTGKIKHRFTHNSDNPNSISGNSVWSIYEDRNKRIWFGMWFAGIDFIDPYAVTFKKYTSATGSNSISSNIVTSFLEDKRGNVWIGTDGGGLNYFDKKTQQFISYQYNPKDPNSIRSNAVLSLCYDNEGKLWVGTWNGGINIFDETTKKFIRINTGNSGLRSNDIFNLLYDGKDKIFVATWGGGLNVYDLKNKTWNAYLTNPTDNRTISSNNVFMLFQDSNRQIWIGTLSDGLNQYKVGKDGKVFFSRYQYYPNLSGGISSNLIHNIYEDSKKRLWVATANGINLLVNEANGTFKLFKKKDGLVSNFVSGITEDSNHNLWISTIKGLMRADSSLTTFHNYDLSDNLQGNHFNKNAVYKTKNGEILFGGSNGFNMFDPQKIISNPIPPKLAFTDFKIFNQSVAISYDDILEKDISVTKQITLSYRSSVFSIDFIALNLTNPEKNQYAYIMEGFEKKWNYSGTKHSATYTNLDPGDYTFRVIAANNDGVWNKEGIVLQITITPPFWKTWWAYTLYLVFLIGAFYAFLLYRLSQERLRHNLEMEHLKLEKLSELDKIKTRFFSNVSHEIKTPIMLIVGPLENLLKSKSLNESAKEKISLIIRNAYRLSRMLNQLIDFYRIESPDLNLNLVRNDLVEFVRNIFLSFKEYAKDHNINYSFNSNMKVGYTWFDGDKIDKMIYNLLSNAFKFTHDEGEIELGIIYKASDSKLQNYVEIYVRDSGIGIPEDLKERIFDRFYKIENDDSSNPQGIGIGLHMTQEFVELHQGNITVESEPGKGSTFRILLPVDVIDIEKEPETHTSQNLTEVEQEKNSFESLDEGSSVETTPLILFVDDDDDVHQYIKDIFQDRFKVISAYDGEEAFQNAVELVPDLIISDIDMPKMDGYNLCHELKNEESTSHIPIILLTVHNSSEDKLKGLKLGATAYLPKPFNSDELKARVQNLLEERRKLRDSFRKQILNEPTDNAILSMDEKFLLRVKQEVENNLDNWKLDADLLSQQVGISRIQLYRKLKGLTGQTVHEFIKKVRLKRAVQLLEKRKMKITEIAYSVGFSDLNYFSRCFRKEFGVAPSEYLTGKNQTE